MSVNGQASYGQVFGMVHGGPYRFGVYVQLEQGAEELQFDIQAQAQPVPQGQPR